MKIPSPDLVKNLVSDLEAEVNNGGFHQFFFNSAGDRSSQISHALRAIGASHTANILDRACAKFPGGNPPTDRFARQEALEATAPNGDEFDAEDSAFYEYKDDLAALVEAYGSG